MQALNGETKGLGAIVDGRQPSRKEDAGKSVTRRHTPTIGGCRRWKVTRMEAHEGLVVVEVSTDL